MAEKDVPFETVQIDLRGGVQMGEPYRSIHLQYTVPVLCTENGRLSNDTAAVAAYLEARYP
jgi:glutathione S-transferase